MFVTFGSTVTGDVGPTLGPWPFVQLTYNMLRGGDSQGDAHIVAVLNFTTGYWQISGDTSGARWTDVTIHNDPNDAMVG